MSELSDYRVGFLDGEQDAQSGNLQPRHYFGEGDYCWGYKAGYNAAMLRRSSSPSYTEFAVKDEWLEGKPEFRRAGGKIEPGDPVYASGLPARVWPVRIAVLCCVRVRRERRANAACRWFVALPMIAMLLLLAGSVPG